MLDNEKNLRRTTDEGWAKMARDLDRAMPVRERRRRPIFWWFAAAGAIAFLATATAFSLFFKKPKAAAQPLAEQIEKAETAAANSTQLVENESFRNKKNSRAGEAPVLKTAQTQPEKLDKSEKAVASKAEKATAKPAFSAVKKAEKGQSNLFGKAQKTAPAAFSQAFSEPFPTQKAASETAEKAPYVAPIAAEKSEKSLFSEPPFLTQNRLQLEPFSALEKAETEAVSSLFLPAPSVVSFKIFDKKVRKNPLRLGFETGIQTLAFEKNAGFYVGFLAEKTVWKKASLQAGLGWNHLRRGQKPTVGEGFTAEFEHNHYLTETADTALLYADYGRSETTTGQGGTPNAPPKQYLLVSGNVFDRVEGKISARVRLGSRIGVGAGMAFSRLLQAKRIGEPDTSKFTGIPGPISGRGPSDNSPSVNELLTDFLPRFDREFFGSASYDFSETWRLTASYHRGVLNQNAVPNHSKKNRFWRLSVVRFF